ncbi:MAG: CCA tRNA nucleotidyltransferase [Candidatus Doudnabacteria bacterium]|nr:CCA tRNA nucleotidyltransferase [Candidatus Doudnabacteria bacterium]
MKLNYKPSTELEKFGDKVFNLLVENFSQTFYVGGMVRDLLLGKTVTDIDIASISTPDQVKNILARSGILYNDAFQKFGVVVASKDQLTVEIATLRRDVPGRGRYPKVIYVGTPKIDSQRRDFTINALYLNPKSGKILDYHRGLNDLKNRRIKFIGKPLNRILEDPLRIIRALRFSAILGFKIDSSDYKVIQSCANELNKITATRMQTEINKIKTAAAKKLFKNLLLSVKNT